MESYGSPSTGFWCQVTPPALGPRSSKKKRSSSVLKPQFWRIHALLQGNKKQGKSVKDEMRQVLSPMACWREVFCCACLSSNWVYWHNLNFFNIVFVSAIEFFFCPCSLQLPSPFLFVTWAEPYLHRKFIIAESGRQGGDTHTVQSNSSGDGHQNAASP